MSGFLISLDSSAPGSFDYEVGPVRLRNDGYLPVARFVDPSGECVCLLLGWPIAADGSGLLSGDIEVGSATTNADQFHKAYVEPLLGSYLAVIAIGENRRIYLDGLGTLSLVYDNTACVAGSSALAILSGTEYSERFDSDLHRSLEIDKEGWFPAGLTAHSGIERLVANHYLDLASFEQVRHQDYCESETGSDVETGLARIAEQCRTMVEGLLASDKKVIVGLTGGGDSRLLLAALRPLVDEIEFYTVEAPGAHFDLMRAGELAERFGLRHRVLPFVRASDEEAEAWDRRVGHCVRTANRRMHPSVYPLEEHICIGGLGGEVGRCFLWPRMDEAIPVEATAIVDALKLAREPELVRRVANWIDELDCPDQFVALDLAYIELRMSSWSSVQSYANPRSVVLHPLAGFSAIEAMTSLPARYRQDDGLIDGFIERYWPELLELPINRYGNWRDIAKPLERATNPRKVFRKVRQIVRTRF